MHKTLFRIKQIKKRIECEPSKFRELNEELSKLQKEFEEEQTERWRVTEEEKELYTEKFKKGEGEFRDETCCYFERESKYPIRVESFEKEDGSIEYDVDSVPFTGY